MDQDNLQRNQEGGGPGTSPRRRALRTMSLGLALLGAALLIGASAAASRGDGGTFGRLFGHHRHGHGPMDAEQTRERAEWAVSFVLHRIDASDEQETQVNDIVDRAIVDAFELLGPHREARAELHALLAAPEVDREALEALRLQHIDVWDQLSRRLLDGIVELSEVLTLEQRSELLEMAQHRRRGHGGEHRGRRHWN